MGGWGSGRNDYAHTPTVEACLHLDADQFTDAVNYPGSIVTVRWGDSEDPEASIMVHLRVNPEDKERATAAELVYTVTDPRSDEKRNRRYTIPIEYTDCNFGGVRPWFRCPGVVDGEACERRVRKLYKPPRGELFLCRECHDLGYRTSRSSGDELTQAELRYRRAFARADAEDRRPPPESIESPIIPERPKGIHHSTFEAHLEDVRAARKDWEEAYMAELRAMTDYLKDVRP